MRIHIPAAVLFLVACIGCKEEAQPTDAEPAQQDREQVVAADGDEAAVEDEAEESSTVDVEEAVAPEAADRAAIEGEWSMVSGKANGMEMPAAMVSTGKRVAKDGETTITMGGQVYFKATFTLDPSTEPKSIDYAMTEGPTAGQTHLGIYEIKEDTVAFCFAAPGDDRPTEFTAEPGSERTLSVWRRDAP
jgi:uncharacterized protein (TIGR03067 family)